MAIHLRLRELWELDPGRPQESVHVGRADLPVLCSA